MNSGKLTSSHSYTIKTIAVAISFSPYCQSILSEAKRLADVFDASLLLIHVGEKTTDKENELQGMLNRLKINLNECQLLWAEGKAAKKIIELCDENKVDLLVLGARTKENMLRFYIGSIARKISRKAKCSVMLITKPSEVLHQYNRVVINAAENSQAENTLNTAFYFAQHLNTQEVFIGQEQDVSISIMLDAETNNLKQKKEIQPLDKLIQAAIKEYEKKGLRVINKTVKGKSGYAISKFAQTKKADLLVVSAPDIRLNVMDRIFTHDLEYILANLPCNLLIVHSRVKE